MTDKNPCIKTAYSTKVTSGTMVGPQFRGKFVLSPYGESGTGVYIRVEGQVFSRSDLKYLITNLAEVYEAM